MITKTNYKLFCLRFLKYFTLNLFALLGAMFIARYFAKDLSWDTGDVSVTLLIPNTLNTSQPKG